MKSSTQAASRLVYTAIILTSCMVSAREWNLASPNGTIAVTIKEGNPLQYMVAFHGNTALEWSPLGISLTDRSFVDNLTFETEATATIDETYRLPAGKCRDYHNHCNELTLTFKNSGNNTIRIAFRAYDDAMAYRYTIEGSGSVEITGETSGFAVPSGATGWVQNLNNCYEDGYNKGITGTDFTSGNLAFPALFQTDNAWILLSEAALYHPYSACHFAAVDGNTFQVKLALAYGGKSEETLKGELPWETPWRVVVIGDDLGDIVETNVIENLNPPCELEDITWVKPGVSAWSWLRQKVRDTEQQKEYIDLAAEMQWEYNLIDVSWPEKVNAQEAIAYGTQKNIGNILWYHWHHLRDGIDAEFQRIKQWGAIGVKIDYFNSDRASMIKWYDDIAVAAAKHRLLVNFHGATIPRGQRRRWPHLLSWEGVAGDECCFDSDVAHNCRLPFTRNVVGPMDYTPKLTTDVHELALSVVFECGIQHFGNQPEDYRASPAKPFLIDFPAAWDETRFIEGYPGEYACLARRSGDEWFIGMINGYTERTITVPLSILQQGSYTVDIYKAGETVEDIAVETVTLKSPGEYTITVPAEGGFCFRVPHSFQTDRTPPTAPSELTVSSTAVTSLEFSWSPAVDDESGIFRYNIYRDNTKVGETSMTVYSDTGISEATTYTYTVSATNGGDVEGPRSQPLSAATRPDTEPPVIAGVLAAGNNTRIVVTFTEPIAREGAENPANYGIDNGVTVSEAVLGGDGMTVTLGTSTLAPDIAYTLTVSGITDRAATPNSIAPNSTAPFRFFPYVQGRMKYRYYEGSWSSLPDFDALTPVSEGTTDGFDLQDVSLRGDNFGIQFLGMIRIDTQGDYSFFTSSDDGSALSIGTTRVVDNDGVHAEKEVSGTATLTVGMHPISVLYFQGGGGKGLSVSWQKPGGSRQALPLDVLYAPEDGNPTVYHETPGATGASVHPTAALVADSRLLISHLNPSSRYHLILSDMRGRITTREQIKGVTGHILDDVNVSSGVFVLTIRHKHARQTMTIVIP